MENLVCIRHRDYKGEKAPILSCKTCCTIYIAAIKKLQLAQRQDTKTDTGHEMALAGNETKI